MTQLNIFGFQIFGQDAIDFLSKTKAQKIAWIKENTNQTDDFLINEFVQNPKITNNTRCIPCREAKEKVTISEIVEKSVETVNATADVPIKVTLKKSKK